MPKREAILLAGGGTYYYYSRMTAAANGLTRLALRPPTLEDVYFARTGA